MTEHFQITQNDHGYIVEFSELKENKIKYYTVVGSMLDIVFMQLKNNSIELCLEKDFDDYNKGRFMTMTIPDSVYLQTPKRQRIELMSRLVIDNYTLYALVFQDELSAREFVKHAEQAIIIGLLKHD